MTAAASRPRPVVVDPRARLVFFLIIGVWLLIPVAVARNLAQDALPYVVAGRLVEEAPDQIYATHADDLYDLPPRFAELSCQLAPEQTDCGAFAVAFVSSPPSLPFAVALGWLGGDVGVFVARMLAALSLSGGMLALWRRAVAVRAEAAVALAASAVLLTPFAMVPITLGQTSPYLFLLACLGVAATAGRPWRALATGIVFAGISLLKLFPAAAGLVLVRQRRWRLVGLVVGTTVVLAGAAAALGPLQWYPDFLTSARLMERYSLVNPYNGAVLAMAYRVSPSLTTGAPYVLVLAATVGALLVGWRRVRLAPPDTQWAYALLGSLFLVPLVWWHYVWVGVAAVAMALLEHPPDDPRRWRILPGLAAVSIVISIPNGTGGSLPVAQFLFLAGTAVLAVVLSGPGSGTATEPVAAPKASPAQPNI